jgi:hypothetical protein
MMGMTLSYGMHQSIKLTQSHSLTLRTELLLALRGENMKPVLKCDHCNRTLELSDILKGFNRNPLDTTSLCPYCKKRFQPKLLTVYNFGRVEVQFWCPNQTLNWLKDKELRHPDTIRRENASVYYSALSHFGSLKNAFKKIGVEYALEQGLDHWENRVTPFLGKAPDVLIAECTGVSYQRVAALRRKLGIDKFESEED